MEQGMLERAYTALLILTLLALLASGLGSLSGMVVFTIGHTQPPMEITFKHALYGNATISILNVSTGEERILWQQALPTTQTLSSLNLSITYAGNFTLNLTPLSPSLMNGTNTTLNATACRLYTITPLNASARLACLGSQACCERLGMNASQAILINQTVYVSMQEPDGNWTKPVKIIPAREDVLCRENCSQLIPPGWRLYFTGEAVPARITYPAEPLPPFQVDLLSTAGRLATLRVQAVAPVTLHAGMLREASCNGTLLQVNETLITTPCDTPYHLLVEADEEGRILIEDNLGRQGMLLVNTTMNTAHSSNQSSSPPFPLTGLNVTLQLSRLPTRNLTRCPSILPAGRLIIRNASWTDCTSRGGMASRLDVQGNFTLRASRLSIPLGMLIRTNATFTCQESLIETGPISLTSDEKATLRLENCTLTGRIITLPEH